MVDNGDGTITYTPDPNFNGSDVMAYQVCDTSGLCDDADVAITVSAVADPPHAVDDTPSTGPDTAIIIDVAANDSDPDGDLDPATVKVIDPPADGAVTVHTDGTITYTPDAGFTGYDTFTYEICDATNLCADGTVMVHVDSFVAPPEYEGEDDYRVGAGGLPPPLVVSEPDGQEWTVTVISGELPPGLVLNPDGTWSGAAAEVGTYQFTVAICDDSVPPNCTTQVLQIEIFQLPFTGLEDGPLAAVALMFLVAGTVAVVLPGWLRTRRVR